VRLGRFGDLAPEILEAIRRQLRVLNRVLDVLVPEESLQGAGIMPLIR
jgi:hypothetical protein